MSEFSVSQERALELCKSFRDKHKVRLFSQCWGCLRFSKEVPDKMCFYKPPNNDGCRFIIEENNCLNTKSES